MGELAPGLAQNLWVTAAVLLACVLLLWLLSIRLRDISIIETAPAGRSSRGRRRR